MNRPKLLFIEDDATYRNVLERELSERFEVSAQATAEQALDAFDSAMPDVCLVDMHLPGMDGLEFLRQLRRKHAAIQIVILTGHGGVSEAVEAMREGAYDFLVKPTALDKLEQTLLKAAEKATLLADIERLKVAAAWSHAEGEILGDSPAMLELKRLIEKFGPREECVLIEGEAGTGRELVALNLHRRSLRASLPFVVANCGAMTPERMAIDLFGAHGNGGLLDAARGGTLFLDGVDALPGPEQASLLRALETRSPAVPSTVRLVAATDRDLKNEVVVGRFRHDLLQRLSALELKLPALRTRRDDIAPLARTFLRRIADRQNTPLELSENAVKVLEAYDWPGNVRELHSAMTRLALMTQHQPIGADDVTQFALRTAKPASFALPSLRLEELEQQALLLALEMTGSDKKAAADQLGVSLRTLYNMLDRYNLKDRFIRH